MPLFLSSLFYEKIDGMIYIYDYGNWWQFRYDDQLVLNKLGVVRALIFLRNLFCEYIKSVIFTLDIDMSIYLAING